MRRRRIFRRIVGPSGVPKGIGTTNQAAEESKRAHNVVDALYEHFKKWQPEVLKCQPPTSDASQK